MDTNKVFTEFFWDVFPEFQAVGQVTMFKVWPLRFANSNLLVSSVNSRVELGKVLTMTTD